MSILGVLEAAKTGGLKKNASISIIIFPLTVFVVTFAILCKGIIMSRPRFGTRTLLLSSLAFLLWIIAFAAHQNKLNKDKNDDRWSIKSQPILVIILSAVIGIFLAYTAWGYGYLTLAPYEMIDNGTAHIDDLFHSAISESWKRSFYPSTLLNDERYLAYHTFSHLILGGLAGIMGMPAYIFYNYLYPILFLPLYCFSIVLSIAAAKAYFENKFIVRYIDIVVTGLFICGFTDNVAAYYDWKVFYVMSESFLFGNMLTFFGYAMTFYFLKKYAEDKKVLILYGTIVIPVLIFLISWAKISSGFIFAIGAIYYVFRKGMYNRKLWLTGVIYAAVYKVCLCLFNTRAANLGGTILSHFNFFANKRYISGPLGMAGHYFIFSVMAVMYVYLDIYRNHFRWEDVKKGKTIWIEAMLVTLIIGLLPITIMYMGNEKYFSMGVLIPSLVMLCGHDYADIDKNAKNTLRPIFIIISFFWCVWMGIHHIPASPLKKITNIHNSNASHILLEIREIVGGKEKEYTAYLDEDCYIGQNFKESRMALFVCPAMTGVGVINATYKHGGYYDYTGTAVDGASYGFGGVDNDRLSYEEALSVAARRGKSKLIHFTKEGYEIVDLK